MSEERPAPPVPPDADLSDFPFTPIFRGRLFGSSFHARSSDAEWRAGVTLWLKSWEQVPAGSLPNDDVDLCRLAELGRDMKTWKKIKAGAMRGWVIHSDGRLYHGVVTEGIVEALSRRTKQSQRGALGAEAKWRKHREGVAQAGLSDGVSSVNIMAQAPPDACLSNASPMLSDGKRQGQGSRQGREEERVEAPRKRGSRLPDDFVVPIEWRLEASEKRREHSLLPVNLDLEAEKFVNHWHGKSGQGGAKLDWHATWINWALSTKVAANGTRQQTHSPVENLYFGAALALDERQRQREADSRADFDVDVPLLDSSRRAGAA